MSLPPVPSSFSALEGDRLRVAAEIPVGRIPEDEPSGFVNGSNAPSEHCRALLPIMSTLSSEIKLDCSDEFRASASRPYWH